jgi:two-component system response regulator (stage 0 sporulation protein F)
MSTRPLESRQGQWHQTTTAPLIMVAEDDPEMRAMLVTALQQAGYRVQERKSGWELLVDLTHDVPPEKLSPSCDLLITDNRMPGVTGLEVIESAEFAPGFPPTILITAFGDQQLHTKAMRMGAVAVIDKPFELDTLLAKVREILG